jgi:hypothetical protein
MVLHKEVELMKPVALADRCCLATGVHLDLLVVGGDQASESLRLGSDVHPIR